MSEERFPINIWINEERYEKLQKAGLAHLCQEMLAGLKVLRVYANQAQRDKILRTFPTAKFDSATTKSIELLPRNVKDAIFDNCVQTRSVDILDEFLSVY